MNSSGWLAPFLARLGRQERRHWAPSYLKGLILPGERKSVEPMAARVAPGDTQQLHHFVSASPWATAPLEDELVDPPPSWWTRLARHPPLGLLGCEVAERRVDSLPIAVDPLR